MVDTIAQPKASSAKVKAIHDVSQALRKLPQWNKDLASQDLTWAIEDCVGELIPEMANLRFTGSNHYGLCYRDNEIQAIHRSIPKGTLPSSDVKLCHTEEGKAVIQQQSERGCAHAAAAMLIYDHNGDVEDLEEELHKGLSQTEQNVYLIRERLSRNGLAPGVKRISGIDDLEAIIREKGSAIVPIFLDSMGGAHVVIVDSIQGETVRLRDPYHGWDVSVNKSAFEASLVNDDVIYITPQPS